MLRAVSVKSKGEQNDFQAKKSAENREKSLFYIEGTANDWETLDGSYKRLKRTKNT